MMKKEKAMESVFGEPTFVVETKLDAGDWHRWKSYQNKQVAIKAADDRVVTHTIIGDGKLRARIFEVTEIWDSGC